MICANIFKLTGITCHPLNDDGSVVMIGTSFVFEDGDPIPVYVEKTGNRIRIFDDGEVLLHFHGRGLTVDNARKTRFIKNIVEENDVSLNSRGEIEILTDETSASLAFSRYISTLISIVNWEKNNIGFSDDVSLLVSEVEQYLKTWKPKANIVKFPEYLGISGQKYTLDFNIDSEAVVAISPHHSAISSAIKKLLDIKSRPENSGLNVLAIIDDRRDKESARKGGLIMEALATVWPVTRLEKHLGISPAKN